MTTKVAKYEILFRSNNLAIEYSQEHNWIYANWRGYNNHESIIDGCERILQFMQEKKCYSILNDNTHVEGIWSGASKWVGQVWFPRMQNAGMKCFAWIYSTSAFSRLSTDKSIRHTEDTSKIQVFDNIEEAKKWIATCN